MALINKTGITDGSLIEAEHITRIIDALTSVSTDTIVATGSFQGTLDGTAALANTASYITTAQTASYILNAVSASFATSASRSTTSSFSLVATSASFASNAFGATSASFASNAFFGVSASYADNSFFNVSSSLAQTAKTASYVLNAVSASFATTASFVLSGVTASFATSASQAISSSRAITASFATSADTASFIRPLNQSVIITGSLNITGSLQMPQLINFINNANLSNDVGATAVYAGGYTTPNIGRLFIGDGTGWQFHFSRRASNITTDLITITDTGVLKLTDENNSSFLFKKSNSTSTGTIIYASRTDDTNGGSLKYDGWGNFSFQNSLAIGKEVAGATAAVRLDVNGNAVLTGSMIISANSTAAGLKVTQTGAGNAFSVEDSASDTSPFIIDATGRCLIGLSSPTNTTWTTNRLEVSGSVYFANTINTANASNAFPVFGVANLSSNSNVTRFIEYIAAISGSNRTLNRFITNGGYNANTSAAERYCSDILLEKSGYTGFGVAEANIVATRGWRWGAFNSSAYEVYLTLNASGSTAGNLGIGVNEPTYLLQLGSDSAGKPNGGSWANSSDERLKENIELADLDLCYDVVKNLPLKRYRWKDNSYTDAQIVDRNVVGWVAQDVAAVFPKAVSEKPFTQVDGTTIDDCLSLNETMINRTLYGAVQKLIAENETLKSELQAIKTHLGL